MQFTPASSVTASTQS